MEESLRLFIQGAKAGPVVDGQRPAGPAAGNEDLDDLERYAADPAAVRADPAQLGHVKYLFVTSIEGCVDAATRCASEG